MTAPSPGDTSSPGDPTLPDDGIAVTRDTGIATLWLNRPDKRNAVTYDMWHTIAGHCTRLAADPSVRLLVVRGAGGHFSAGADIAGLADVSPAEYQAANLAADEALATFPKPTIAFVTGVCIGGGAELAIACDLRIADTTARFGITPARLGIVYPATALERAAALIGTSATKHLLYSAEIIDAERALRIGLVDELLEPGDATERLVALTTLLAHERSLMTQQATKEMLADIGETGSVREETRRRWEDELARSPDPTEGVIAFLERRPPRFTWGRDDAPPPGDHPPN